MATVTTDESRVEIVRHAYDQAALESLAVEWAQAAADYRKDAAKTVQAWWRKDRLQEAKTALQHAVEFAEAARRGTMRR